MEIAVTKNAGRSRKFGGHVVQLGFQLCCFSMAEVLTTQTLEIMFYEEVELPGEFGFVKRQPARDRFRLMGPLRCLLDARNQIHCPLFVVINLCFRRGFVNAAKLPIPEILLHNNSGRTIDRIDFRNGDMAL